MKKLLKLPLLLITLLLIFSCGRNAEADVNAIEDAFERLDETFIPGDGETKEILEERIDIFLESEEIFSYYVDDANSDETLSFIKLLKLRKVANEFERIKDKEGLRRALYELKKEIREVKEEIDEM
jgi:hypothetical protein